MLVLASVLAIGIFGFPAATARRDASVGAASSTPLTVSIGSASVVVTAQGEPSISFPVTLSKPATKAVSVFYRTSNGSAKAGKSYRSTLGKLAFSVNAKTGQTATTAFVAVGVYPSPNGGPGTFLITLTRPAGASLGNAVGLGTILPRTSGAAVRVSAGDMRVYDGTGGGLRLARVHVTLSRPAPESVGLHWSIAGASAVSGKHFQAPKSGALKIAKGDLGGWVDVAVFPGTVLDKSRTLSVKLTRATGASINRSTGIVTIAPEPAALVFDDEFNGTALDLSKWEPNWLAGNNSDATKPIHITERSCYDPAQVSEPGDGYLHLAAVERSCSAADGKTYPYASGLVESQPHFTFTYGFLEARMRLPAAGNKAANWPAFWTDGTGTWPTTGELDVMEGLDGKNCFHFHSPAGSPGACPSVASPSGWHTYAARWAPGSVTYYYDGNRVGQITTGITGAPMYPILNYGVGGEGGPISVPATLLVDWVRISK